MADSRLISLRRPEFNPRQVCMGFMVDKLTVWQVSLQVLRVFPVTVFPLLLHT